MADILVTGQQAYFNEDAKFFKDVYIYGNLYYDFESFPNPIRFGDITVNGTSIFNGPSIFNDNVTFNAPFTIEDLTVTKRLSVLGNSVFSGISTFNGTVNTTEDLNAKRLYVSDYFGVGLGNTTISASGITGKVGIGSTVPEQKLDVSGSVKINKDIYDSLNSAGAVGSFLTKDDQGIKWTPFTPAFTEGIFVYNEGVLVGVQSFRGINLKTGRGVGLTTDPIQGFVNPTNSTIADIYTYDFWEFVEGSKNIYRNSNVGINNPSPAYALDVSGQVNITLSLDVGGAATLKNTLDVTSTTKLRNTLDVDGVSTFNSNTQSTDKDSGAVVITNGGLGVEGNAYIGGNEGVTGTLNVDGIVTLNNSTQSTTKDNGALVVANGGVGIEQNLNVGGVVKVFDTTQSTDKDTGSLVVDGGVGIEKNLNVGGDTNIIGILDVTDATRLRSTLQVGTSGTVITTNLAGLVGLGTNNPTKPIDVAKDLIIRRSLYDANSNVGYDTNFYQTPRSVLTQVGVDDAGQIISGRFFDAANMIRLNLDFIAAEAVGYITSTDYKNPVFVVPGVGGASTCRNDIKSILKAITIDITKGGNVQSVGAGQSYYNGNSLIHINGTDVNGYSVKDAAIAAIGAAASFAKYVINNATIPYSYQITPSGRGSDAARLIQANKDFIATEAVDRTYNAYPSLVIPNGYQNCVDDIKLILDAISYNLQFTGNEKVYDAAKFYIENPGLIYSQKTESIYAYQRVADVANQIITNVTVTKISGTRNTFTQIKNLSITADPATGSNTNPASCSDTRSAITQFVGIVTTAISSGTLPSRTPSTPLTIRQIKDLTLPNDNKTNLDSNGCANVTSAIYTCANIVTTIINSGPNVVPINNPDGKIIWAPAGADSRNLIWVSKYGNDDNGGNTEGDAKLTIGAAAAIAQPGDTIMIRPGVYYENNPIGLRTDVGVSGQDLRLVTVVPKNLNRDIFHVRRGCLIENMNFACDTGESNIGGGALAFPPTIGDIVAGKSYAAVSGYTAPGPATEGPSGRWRSPYVRNCTNFMPLSIGMKINGDHATASTIGADLKCMVCDSFTQYNEAGIGVSITNNGYAQLVSLFTINCDKAVYTDTGGQCDLTNSNSSFGNYGLYAVGLGRTEFTGIVTTSTTAEADIITFSNVTDGTQVRRPYDGQALWFKINLNNYLDTPASGIITAPMQRLKKINIINGGSGYSSGSPPIITIYDSNTNDTIPLGPEGIIAEVSPTISDAGAITAVDLVNSGRNYLASQNMKVRIDGVATNNLTAVMEPIYYTVSQATPATPVTGITTVTLNEFVPYLLYSGNSIEMRRISRILTSGHSFEYIGTGTDINTSTPLKGAVPIKANEIVALDGAQIPYTSTDQKGNFNIGQGIQVNQTTATITGRDFSKAIQAEVTPLILALR